MSTADASIKLTHGTVSPVMGSVTTDQVGKGITVTIGNSKPAQHPRSAASVWHCNDEAELAHQVKTLEGILAMQREEQSPNAKTVWTPINNGRQFSVMSGFTMTTVMLGGERRSAKERHEARRQQRLGELRSKAFMLATEIETGKRNPTQRMFDAIQRHDHDALRRAIADGADVNTRYESCDGDPKSAGRVHPNGTMWSFHKVQPLHWAVVEDDPDAVNILIGAHDESVPVETLRAEVLRVAIGVGTEKGIPCPLVIAMLEAVALRETLQDNEPAQEPVRARARARL